MKNLARFLTTTRETKKLTIRALARDSGVDASAISRAEGGRPIRPGTLKKLLAALGISANSPDYIEAFALHAADSSLDAGLSPVSSAAITKKIGSSGRARASAEDTILSAYRALSPDRQDTIDYLLKNPRSLDAFAELRQTLRTK